jgi:arylsulfatase A-like enzyme
VHYFEPHGPYRSPASFLRPPKTHGAVLPAATVDLPGKKCIPLYQINPSSHGVNDYIARYQAAARYAIFEVDRLLRTGIRSGALADSAIVYTSDHGEALGEEDYWFQHQIPIDPSLVHVPLVIVRGSGLSEPACDESRPVGHLDILPTVLSLLLGGPPLDTRGADLFAPHEERPYAVASEFVQPPSVLELGAVVADRLIVQSSVRASAAFRLDNAAQTSYCGRPRSGY